MTRETDLQSFFEAVANAPFRTIAPYLTRNCFECGGTSAKFASGYDTKIDDFDHLIFEGFVISGCEGYPYVDPTVVGLPDLAPDWVDWRDEIEGYER